MFLACDIENINSLSCKTLFKKNNIKEENRAYIADVKEKGDCVKLSPLIKRTGLDRLTHK